MAPAIGATSCRGEDSARRAARARACACAVAGLALVAGGCASLPLAPAYPNAGAAGPAGLARDEPPSGAIRAGDQLSIEITSGNESHKTIGIVDARGDVHVTSGRDVAVGGLSLESAEQRVTAAVRSGDKFAEVDLQLATRPSQRVSVLGALRKPGYLALTPGMRVVDVVAAAGGLLTLTPAAGARTSTRSPVPVADVESAVLVREGKALPIDFEKALQGQPGHNVLVHPGDRLYVPFAAGQVVSVFGQVGTPTVIAHRSGLRMTEALSAAGGLTAGGDKSDIRLLRGPPEAPKAYQASLRAIADGEQHDVVLAPGDVLFVKDDPVEDIGEVVRLFGSIGAAALGVLAVYLIVAQ
jgi:polysaccharide export outer membrane protein